MFDDAELITEIRSVRYSRIRIPSSKRIIVIGRNQRLINEILAEKKGWIEKKLRQLKEMEDAAGFENGNLHFFGEPTSIDSLNGLSSLEISRKFRSALLEHASKTIDDSTLIHPKIEIRRMRSRLGVYSTRDDTVRLSVYLAFMPKELIDYVIHHELSHRDVRHHGTRFWQKVASRYPDYKQKEKELDIWWLRAKKLIKTYGQLKQL